MLNLKQIGFVYRAMPSRQLARQLHTQMTLGEIIVLLIAALVFGLILIVLVFSFGTLGLTAMSGTGWQI